MVSHHFVVSMQNTGSIGDIGELGLREVSIARGSNRQFHPDYSANSFRSHIVQPMQSTHPTRCDSPAFAYSRFCIVLPNDRPLEVMREGCTYAESHVPHLEVMQHPAM